MSENMQVWNAVSRPPKEALKQIGGGRLKGKTEINPQWRYEIMTQMFGLCGIGWKMEIVRLWTEPGFQPSGSPAEVFAFAEIHVFVKHDGVWSEPIPGIGGNLLVESESRGMHNNDEAFKMAVTDAFGTAIKMLGVGSEIYAGRWDGSKYQEKPSEQTGQVGKPSKPAATSVVDVEDLDKASKSWVDTLNEMDTPAKLHKTGKDLAAEPRNVQDVVFPYYCQVWDRFIRKAASKEELDAIGAIIATESKGVIAAVKIAYKAKLDWFKAKQETPKE